MARTDANPRRTLPVRPMTIAFMALVSALALWGLSLYRTDLSAVVSKYIGETERNLRRAFARAESVDTILLLDEADTLFGKRAEVKAGHKRTAKWRGPAQTLPR